MRAGRRLYRPIAAPQPNEARARIRLGVCLFRACARRAITTLLVPLFLTAEAGAAQEPVQLEVTATAEVRQQVSTPDGRVTWRFKPAGALRQGDEVFFTLHVHNPTPVVAPDVTVTWPVPANTILVPGSATGPAADVSYSVDGGRTFARGAQLRIVEPGGGRRAATAEDFTHIRWHLRYPLAPQAMALARFRAVFK